MNSIFSIEISFSGLFDRGLVIDPTNNKAITYDGEKSISTETIEQLLDIICLWDDFYYDNRLIDAECCKVIINSKNSTKEYYMQGTYPRTYAEFKSIVGEIYG
ncbi:MAG: hypothetical protein IKH36_03980 [Bacilli bacterium]|nr:hypothetical protein [Bacilli bacterium]